MMRDAARLAVFSALGLFIVFAPLAAQVVEIKSRWLRPWTMFSEVGVGVLKGKFRLEFTDGTRAVLTPLEVLGLERYPPILSIRFPAQIHEDRDLRFFARDFCQRRPVRMSYHGWTGTRDGWRRIEFDGICDGMPEQ